MVNGCKQFVLSLDLYGCKPAVHGIEQKFKKNGKWGAMSNFAEKLHAICGQKQFKFSSG